MRVQTILRWHLAGSSEAIQFQCYPCIGCSKMHYWELRKLWAEALTTADFDASEQLCIFAFKSTALALPPYTTIYFTFTYATASAGSVRTGVEASRRVVQNRGKSWGVNSYQKWGVIRSFWTSSMGLRFCFGHSYGCCLAVTLVRYWRAVIECF